MSPEEELKIALDRARQGTGALFIAVQDVLGFLSVYSADTEDNFVRRWLQRLETTAISFTTLDTGNSESPPDFSFGDVGKYYYYIGVLNPQLYVIGLFPKRVGAAKVLYGMGGVVEELRQFTDVLSELKEISRRRYVEQKEKEGELKQVRRKKRYLSPHQIEALKDTFINEIGPAGDYIFNAVIIEKRFNRNLLTKEDAYELIDYLTQEIDSLDRAERFVKTALSIVDEEAL
ncbi:hypothetical protein BCF55_0058 [Hydrogenivirga caldilitoris]|uniref:DUF8082 domain-containing protein n=1 Tax=Hydrogenivirga caldilitoris TaxID=246264 RepID=A0A497XRN8_9AQUI|nr:hypothetical protein [Hydrogenivirga caldilitoris]RLJ69802.1 hypothetical protein BCF55_0058 [Hydrogenivirga caldilitoris]